MSSQSSAITILGAGLTGLTLACLLKKVGYKARILEARDRLGGRIYTKRVDDKGTSIEMGATWLGKKHHHLVRLLEEFGLGMSEQYLGDLAIYEPISTSPPQLVTLPPNPDPSYRIEGGSQAIIDALVEALDEDQILLDQAAESIEQNDEGFVIRTKERSFSSDIIISTLPPNLLVKTISIEPSLPDELKTIAQMTHTWMGESIKVGLSYEHSFWRKDQTSGTIFSNVGPVSEMYDHSGPADNSFALKGFMNGAYQIADRTKRREVLLSQLRKYFGVKANTYLAYEEAVWADEPYTYVGYESPVLPHQNNGNAIFRQPYLDDKFFVAGSETATSFPGYMDGAVESAYFVFDQIKKLGYIA